MSDIKEYALGLAERGTPIFPCGHDKRPLTQHGFKDASRDPDQINAWWARWSDAWIGMPTGEISGRDALDLDVKGDVDGRQSLSDLEDKHGKLPDTIISLTPSGGEHRFFTHVDGIRNSASKLAPGIDIRGEGGYVILPPSGDYEWEASTTSTIAEWPEWLRDKIFSIQSAGGDYPPGGDGGTDEAAPIAAGGRNEHLTSLAGTMQRRNMGHEAILAALLEVNQKQCDPPLGVSEVRLIAKSVSRYKPAAQAQTSNGPPATVTNIDEQRQKKTKIYSSPNTPSPNAAGAHFRPLGYHREYIYFLTTRGKQVLTFKLAQLSSKPVLMSLAPLQWWESTFPSTSGFKGQAVDQAVNFLLSSCYARGVFHLDRLRGLGCWWDDGRAVIHAGDHLLVNNERRDVHTFQSRFVYEQMPAVPVDLNRQATRDECQQYLELCRMLNWSQPFHGTLLAGWAVASLACGALRWRPHIMITGGSGSGKTWVSENVLQPLLDDTCAVAIKGESTEAGLRQKLQMSALPVIYDEAESDTKRAKENMDRMLGLMRQSSAEVGGTVLKGGAEGVASSYQIRSMFCLIAIRVPMEQTADLTRTSVLSLDAKKTPDDIQKFAQIVRPAADAVRQSDIPARIRSRIYAHISVLRENAERFTSCMAKLIHDQRVSDQLGVFLAGAWLLHSTDLVPPEIATERCRGILPMISDHVELIGESDEEKLISSICAQIIDVDGSSKSLKRTVGELIDIVNSPHPDAHILKPDAESALGRIGILTGIGFIYVANRHEGLSRILQHTSWGTGWSRILRRISGAISGKNVKRFAGVVSRYISIPIESWFKAIKEDKNQGSNAAS